MFFGGNFDFIMIFGEFVGGFSVLFFFFNFIKLGIFLLSYSIEWDSFKFVGVW